MLKIKKIAILTFFVHVFINMQSKHNNPLERQMLYAPFRATYFEKSKKKKPTTKNNVCIFCKLLQENTDEKNFIVARFKHLSIWLNLYPYNKGHILIIPYSHVENLNDLCNEEKLEIMEIICEIPDIFKEALNADGANIGINFGKAAGASKPDHMHIHALPRYAKEKDEYTEIIPKKDIPGADLEQLYYILKEKFDQLFEQLYN